MKESRELPRLDSKRKNREQKEKPELLLIMLKSKLKTKEEPRRPRD